MDPSINIHFLCRLCGSKTLELQRINMFDSAGVLLEVTSKIKFCLGIDIDEKDNLPEVICTDCVDSVDNFSKFKKNAVKTTELLQGLFSQQTESIENSQNSCNIEDSIFDTANYISDPEELIIKADDSDSFFDQSANSPVIENRKKVTKRKRSKKPYKRCKNSSGKQQKSKNITSYKVAQKTETKNINAIRRQKKLKPSSYNCEICEKIFLTRSCIYKHMVRHFSVETTRKMKCKHVCSFCMKYFRTKTDVSEHIKNKHQDINEPKIVEQKSENNNKKKVVNEKETKYVNVTITHRKIKISSTYECDICQKIFQSRASMYRHMVRHFAIKKRRKKSRPSCSYCMKEFRSKHELTRHVNSKHEQRMKEPRIIICHFCGQTFNDRGRFKYHLNTRHPQEFPFECNKCNKKFAIKELLRSHINNLHNENKVQWVCDTCGKSLASKNSLTKHKIRHEKTPEELHALKIYKCLVCDARYDHPCNLRYHMRMHTGETLFECNICQKRFIRKNALNIHILTHTGERKFVCDVCGKAFAIKKNLDIHKLIHTGERRFQCKDCDKTYTQNSTLNIHLKKTGHTRKKL